MLIQKIQVILKHLKDIQLALVIARLYEDPVTTAMRRVLNTHVLGVANDAKTVGKSLWQIRYEITLRFHYKTFKIGNKKGLFCKNVLF